MAPTTPACLAQAGKRADGWTAPRPGMFSVVMPAYNHAEYIPEAMGSIQAQSLADWELIVVDDGSSDGTAEVAEAIAAVDGRIRIIRQANAGPAAARNAGTRAARADWLAFLDSDDLWYPRTLEHYADGIARRPDGQFFHGYRDRLNRDGTATATKGQFQDAPTGAAELFGRMFLSTMVVCIARALAERCGGFDESLRSCEDYELFLRLSLLTRFWPIGAATGLRRRHERNISTQTGFSRFQEAEVLRRFVERQGGSAVVPEELVRRRLARLYYASARQYFKARCVRKALVAANESLAWRGSVKVLALKAACAAIRPLGRDDGRPIPWLRADGR